MKVWNKFTSDDDNDVDGYPANWLPATVTVMMVIVIMMILIIIMESVIR